MMRRFSLALIIAVVVLGVLSFVAWNILRIKTATDLVASKKLRSDISVTIIEGKRREEVAAQLAAAGVTGYQAFLTATKDSEGMLYPDTYRFFPDTPASEVAAKLTTNYESRLSDLTVLRDRLILASIVEREALNDADRATIAGVYQNRIDRGMDLQADPTVQYSKDSLSYAKSSTPQSFNFWQPILRADYRGVNYSFNTYLNESFPPGPICSPGKKSIEAALSPANHDYIFFGYKDDKLLLAKTLTQHEAQLK